MQNLLVDIFTPGNGKSYEYLLDGLLTAGQVMEKIAGDISEFENQGIALDPASLMFVNLSTGAEIPGGSVLWEAGVRSGHRLMLL